MGIISDTIDFIQDTFSNTQNGSTLIRQAAMGNISGSNFKIGFTSLGSAASIKNRVYIKVPKIYYEEGTKLQLLSGENGKTGWDGIYFPVTPTIRQDAKANWTASNVQQSNYAIYSYNNSDVGSISVSGQFPVQTQREALYWLSTVHALRSLTKMRTGNDVVPGAPPPVCRFFAYGRDVYENVPVVIQSYSIELPADVDYITGYNTQNIQNKVPTLSSITLTLLPVYSRREMSRFTVDGYVQGSPILEGKGYL